ncbi:hypothetical protein [Rudanella lutea]|uniref:hypothetical protein n=1 Tax=Rudanella lutea TaxID=451374 RepID=UPI000487A0CD|nr:hypothetical protein [Rudanella lutea]
MATLSHSVSTSPSTTSNGLLAAYNAFVEKAEFNRIGWAASALMFQGCILTPALLITMFFFNGSDWQLLVGNLSFLLVLVPILGAMHVKYIFPSFGVSLLIHLALILVNIL